MLFPKYTELILENHDQSMPDTFNYDLRDELSERLCKLSFTRQESVWNEENVAWLKEILKRFEELRKTLPVPNFNTQDRQLMNRYARCRLFDLSDKVNLLPREVIFEDEQQRFRHLPNAGEGVDLEGLLNEEHDNVDPRRPTVNFGVNDFLLFFQTLLPWARLPNEQQEGLIEEDQMEENDEDGEDVN